MGQTSHMLGARRAATHDVLLACLRQSDVRQPAAELAAITDPEVRRELAAEAVRHRIEGAVYLQTKALGWPDDDGAALLREHHNGTFARHLHMSNELHAVTARLETAGVTSLAFKGPLLAECTYVRPDLRAYGDIDVLIRPEDLRQALAALHETGTEMYSESWDELRRTERAQLNLTTARGVPLDLHWHLLNNPHVRKDFRLETRDLLSRRRPRTVMGRRLYGLGEADELIFLAAHAAQSGGALLVWNLDLHLAASRVRDWDEVVQVASTAQLGLVTSVMLSRARQLFGTPLPDGVLEALSSARTWRTAVHFLDRVRPPQRAQIGTGRMLLTSTRHTTADSLRQLGRALWSEALVPFATDPRHPWRRALTGRDEAPGPSGFDYRSLDPAPDRDAFLVWVHPRNAG